MLRNKLIATVPAIVIVWASIVLPDLQYNSLDRYFYDAIISMAPPITQESRIVIVDIDERSLASEGTWPWPRATVAKLIRELTDNQHVAMLGLDIVFPESRAGDALLQAALDQPQVVMSQILDFQPGSNNHIGKLSGGVAVSGSGRAQAVQGYIANHSGLLPARELVGHISPLIDVDGQVRRLYPLACLGQTCSVALSLRMYLQLMANDSASLQAVLASAPPALRLQATTDNPLDLPLDQQGAWLVPYRVAPGGFAVLSAADVLHAGRMLPELENTLVLVGSSALGIGDKVSTPLSAIAPGVEVHAQLLSALLDQHFIRPLPAKSPLFLALAAVVVLSWLVWPRRGRHAMLAWLITLLVTLSVLLPWLLLHEGLWLPLPVLPLMVISISLSHILMENLALAERVSRVASRLGQFLPSVLIDRLEQASVIGPETELRTMTVLIADIRGFTAASEGKTPQQIAEFAQKCFEVLSAEVERYQGTIERYSGDGLVSLWGAPGSAAPLPADAPLHVLPATEPAAAGVDTAHAPYAARALSAAIAMQRAIASQSEWFAQRQYVDLQLCIGINTGPMSVGVFGGKTHLTWSAQGQAFNIASRIESLTRETGENILLGEPTSRLIAQEDVRPVGSYSVKGVSAPVTVYAPRESTVVVSD